MKERPISFNAEMVRAILDGRKTQTRRIMKVQPDDIYHYTDGVSIAIVNDKAVKIGHAPFKCPYGEAGDRLWVRETFVVGHEIDDCSPVGDEKIWYRATDDLDNWYDLRLDREVNVPWKPPIQMSRWASRITIDEITDIRIEQLQDISRGDCMAEGCPFPNIAHETDPVKWYKELWESIYGRGSWDENPWLWLIEFKQFRST